MRVSIGEDWQVFEGRCLSVCRGDKLRLEVCLPACAGGVRWDKVLFGGKLVHDGGFVVFAEAVDVGESVVLSLNFNGEALSVALGGEACVVVPCEFELHGGGVVQSVRGVKLKVWQDLIKGSEVAPGDLPGLLSIGGNGNWWIEGKDSGRNAVPRDGRDGVNGKDGVNGAELPLFTFLFFDHKPLDRRFVVSDGGWISGGVYVSAYDFLVAEYGAGVSGVDVVGAVSVQRKRCGSGMLICDGSQDDVLSQLYVSTGSAWFYVLDVVNKRFRLPRSKNFVRGGDVAGGYSADKIVNLRGSMTLSGISNSTLWINGDGVFRSTGTVSSGASIGASNTVSGMSRGFDFDASRSVSTGDQVQPRANEMLLVFFLGDPVAVGYVESRRVAYGDVGAQLDMIYHDRVDGTTTFVDHVAGVKAAFPKSVV